jgi:hypothetical protein
MSALYVSKVPPRLTPVTADVRSRFVLTLGERVVASWNVESVVNRLLRVVAGSLVRRRLAELMTAPRGMNETSKESVDRYSTPDWI